MGQQAAAFAPCVARVKGDNGSQDPQQLAVSLEKVEKLLLDTETLQRECDAHFRRAGLDAHGTMRRVELRRLLWTFAHSLGSTELTWEAIEAFAVTGTLEANVPVVTKEEFFRCVTKTVHLVASELRRKLQEVENKLRPLPRRPPERAPEQSGPTPKTPGRHSSPWAAMAELSGSEEESPLSSSRSANGPEAEPEQAPPEDAIFRPAPCGPCGPCAPCAPEEKHPACPVAHEAHEAPRPVEADETEPEAESFFRPAPEPQAPHVVKSNNDMIVLVLSSEGNFDPQRLALESGSLLLGPMEEANGALSSFFGVSDNRSAFDLSFLEMLLRGSAIARSPAARMIPGVVWKTPESIARTVMLCFPEGSALCMWFQETEHCAACCKAILEEALASGAQPCCDGLDLPSKDPGA